MFVKVIETNNIPLMLSFEVETKREMEITFEVINPNKPKTVYFKQFKNINGIGQFIAPIVFMPQNIEVRIYDANNINYNLFKVTKQIIEPFKSKFKLNDIKNKDIVSFLKFALWFSENASIFSASEGTKYYSVYNSDDNLYRINYYDKFINNKGQEEKTPCKVNINTGIIDVQKSVFIDYTVPMRILILLHEFSHIYINRIMHDEEECDYWALLIYLGLGLPKVEAEKAFLTVFIKTPTDSNAKRYKNVENIIHNFHNIKLKIF